MAIVKCEKNLFYVNIIKIWFGDAFLHSHIFSQNIKIRSNTLFVNQLQLKLTYLKNNFGTSEYFDALLGLKLKKIRTSGWYKIRIHLLFTAMTVKQRVIQGGSEWRTKSKWLENTQNKVFWQFNLHVCHLHIHKIYKKH